MARQRAALRDDGGQAGRGIDAAGADRRAAILDAAEALFLRYGIRRTAIEDVAREAGIAKGTVYLSFRSKEALFTALAERLARRFLGDARAALASDDIAEALTEFLDAGIGAPGRILHTSPHAAEILEGKTRLAGPVMQGYERRLAASLRGRLARAGLARPGAVEMFLGAALGAKRTGPMERDAYRARLRQSVETLLAGLRAG